MRPQKPTTSTGCKLGRDSRVRWPPYGPPVNWSASCGKARRRCWAGPSLASLPHGKRRLIGPTERHAVDDGLYRLQLDLAVALVVAGIDEGDGCFHHIHDLDVAGRANLKRADLGRAVDDLGRRDGRHRHHLLERETHRHELAHDIWQIWPAR